MKMIAKHKAFFWRDLIIISFLMSFMLIAVNDTLAQDGPQRVYMYLDYFQNDQEQYLVSELKYREEGQFYQLANIEVDFFAETDTSKLALGSVKTNEHGLARLDLTGKNIVRDSTGSVDFRAAFIGNDSYKKARKSISIKEIVLSLESETVDSVFTLTVNGHEKVGGEMVPIEDAEFQILTKRLYSDLPVAEAAFEDGEFEFEFPSDIPGDAFGDLWVIGRLTEHDDYGTVETRKKVRWGVPVSYELESKPRALWSRAPLWIIFSVCAAFLLVWYHYWLAVSKLFRIRKL